MPSPLGRKPPLGMLNLEPSSAPDGKQAPRCPFPTSTGGTWLELEPSGSHGWAKICKQFSNVFIFIQSVTTETSVLNVTLGCLLGLAFPAQQGYTGAFVN